MKLSDYINRESKLGVYSGDVLAVHTRYISREVVEGKISKDAITAADVDVVTSDGIISAPMPLMEIHKMSSFGVPDRIGGEVFFIDGTINNYIPTGYGSIFTGVEVDRAIAFSNAIHSSSTNGGFYTGGAGSIATSHTPTSTNTNGIPNRTTTDLIVIHWVGPGSSYDYIGENGVEKIRRSHLQRGFYDIGYHYLIDRNGEIFPGRPESKVGAHVYGHNRNSIGICMMYGTVDTEVTEVSLKTLEKKVDDLCKKYNLKKTKSTIKGHRDLNATECPGIVYKYLDRVRDYK